MRLLSATILAATLSVLGALPAQAATCRHQPGQGAIDQYCEIIPSGAGERPDRTGGGGGGTASLPAKTSQALRAAGPDGRSVATLAESSPAPKLTRTGDGQSGSPASDGGSGTESGATNSSDQPVPSSGTLHALVGDLDSGPGGRSWLPWALLTIAVGAGLTAWLRRGRWS